MTNYITKDQIRKGDVLRVTFEPFKGVVLTREGTAGEEDIDGDWYALTDEEDSFPDFLTFIGGRTIDTIELLEQLIDTIELLEQPLPTEPGTVFRATEIRGEKCDVTVLVGEPYPGEDSARYLSSHFISASATHSPHHITAWEPLDD